MIIYKTTNLINGKIYIGQDSHDNKNYLGSGKLIKYAIKKYGKINFKKERLIICHNQNELDVSERYFTKIYNSINKEIGYNISIGGRDGMTLGRSMSDETKDKIRKSRIGVKCSNKTKKKMSDAKKGIKLTNNTKIKIGNANRGKKLKPLSDETKLKISKSKIGIILTDETKTKMSEAKKGKLNSFYGKSHNDKTKSTISKMNSKKVIKYNLNGVLINTWTSLSNCANEIELSISYLSACIKKNKVYNKHIYSYG